MKTAHNSKPCRCCGRMLPRKTKPKAIYCRVQCEEATHASTAQERARRIGLARRFGRLGVTP